VIVAGRLTTSALCLFLAVACGQLPRPFQPEDKSVNGLLHLADGMGILVQPLNRDAPADPEAAAEILAAALRARNLPASARGQNGAGRVLSGQATILELPGYRDELLIYWELADADGTRIGSHAQRSELTPGAWQAGDPETVSRVLARSAEAIAAMVQGAPAEPSGPPEPAGSRLVILPMQGLPGDGAQSLAQALAAELDAASLSQADQAAENDLLIACTVTLGPPHGYWQEIRVTWDVKRAGDGAQLGQIEQRNRVPAGSLDGPWGPAAQGIAEGAAAGIRDLVAQLGRAV
jgi:hypothetical protein